MSKRAKLYSLLVAVVLIALVLVNVRSCRTGNDPQSLDDTVIEQEELSPQDDTTGIRQSEE